MIRYRKKASHLVKQIDISTEHITLGQFLKLADIIQTGGMAKWFLSEHKIYVNGELENRRGKKLISQDIVDIPGYGQFKINA
jgi:ribosome-associated protein